MLFDENLIEYQCDNNFIKVKYNDTILLIETPFMRIPFGIKELNFNNKKSYNFQISINEDYNIKSRKLLEFIIKIENHGKDKIKDLNSQDISSLRNILINSLNSIIDFKKEFIDDIYKYIILKNNEDNHNINTVIIILLFKLIKFTSLF